MKSANFIFIVVSLSLNVHSIRHVCMDAAVLASIADRRESDTRDDPTKAGKGKTIPAAIYRSAQKPGLESAAKSAFGVPFGHRAGKCREECFLSASWGTLSGTGDSQRDSRESIRN